MMQGYSALDLILKNLIISDFNQLEVKNWDAVSKLVPGTTPQQCSKRYEELLSCGTALKLNKLNKINSGLGLSGTINDTDSNSRSSRPTSASRNKYSKEESKKKDQDEEKTRDEHGVKKRVHHSKKPVMVIHVCDEAKDLKKDFFCPRDLLVKEMKYFAEYLSSDAQRWEEVDISVHCDVQIFDWLMKYAKRHLSQSDIERPKLEPGNVVSILISSDFLKMDSLVQECIEFCYKNISAIVSTNCNMNCINDTLLSRIADLFSHTEGDEILDRKDKFKSKLFSKKLEKLFDRNYNSPDSLGSASSLHRCSVCKRLLTDTMKKRVKCMPSRMTIDKHGNLTYSHLRDTSFDVNEYLIDLKSQLKTWKDVYWRVWGTINTLPCSRCSEIFPLVEFGHCKYHPEAPRYDNSILEGGSCIGNYPCCHQNTLRFDPTQQNKGCRVKDHIVYINENTSSSSPDVTLQQHQKVYDDLLAHREIICVPYQRPTETSDQELNIFDNEKFAVHSHYQGATIPTSMMTGEDNHSKTHVNRPVPRLQALTVEQDVSIDYDDYGGMGESEDEMGDEESVNSSKGVGTGVKKIKTKKKSRVMIDPQAILLGAPEFEQNKKSTWDSGRSTRFNQDAQRQEDHRRMKQICLFLTKLRLNTDKSEKPARKEVSYPGGLFCRIEAQWKAANAPQTKSISNQPRPKMRLSSLRSGIL